MGEGRIYDHGLPEIKKVILTIHLVHRAGIPRPVSLVLRGSMSLLEAGSTTVGPASSRPKTCLRYLAAYLPRGVLSIIFISAFYLNLLQTLICLNPLRRWYYNQTSLETLLHLKPSPDQAFRDRHNDRNDHL